MEQQQMTLGERIVLAARMAAERHVQLLNEMPNEVSAARRHIETGGAGPALKVKEDLTIDQPSIGVRVASDRTRAPRAAAAPGE